MEEHQVNPWTWQRKLGFSQAWRVDRTSTAVGVTALALPAMMVEVEAIAVV
jgi:hypothetical protein